MGSRIQHLINYVREHTENTQPVVLDGITDQEIVVMFNQAQDRLVSKIIAVYPNIFVEEEVLSSVDGQEAYDIPSRAFADNRLQSVEYTADSSRNDYFKLVRSTRLSRDSDTTGLPVRYFRRNNKVYLSPMPDSSTGKIRLSYVRRANDLDIKRSIVKAVTVAGGAITALTAEFTGYDLLTLSQNFDYLCIVDFDGNTKVANIPFSSINTVNGVVTIQTTTHTLAAGESVALNDVIVGGKWASTHTELPEVCDRYLTQFVIWKLFKRDSSDDSKQAAQELAMIEEDIIESYSDTEEDVKFVSILNPYETW